MTEIISIRARIPSIRTESRNEDRGEKEDCVDDEKKGKDTKRLGRKRC